MNIQTMNNLIQTVMKPHSNLRKARRTTEVKSRKRKPQPKVLELSNYNGYGNRFIVSGHFIKDEVLNEFHFIVVCHVHFSSRILSNALRSCELFDYQVCGLGVIERDKMESKVPELILTKGYKDITWGVYELMLKIKKNVNKVK